MYVSNTGKKERKGAEGWTYCLFLLSPSSPWLLWSKAGALALLPLHLSDGYRSAFFCEQESEHFLREVEMVQQLKSGTKHLYSFYLPQMSICVGLEIKLRCPHSSSNQAQHIFVLTLATRTSIFFKTAAPTLMSHTSASLSERECRGKWCVLSASKRIKNVWGREQNTPDQVK